MSLTSQQCAKEIINASRPVLQINGFTDTEWFRKPDGARKGPWLQGCVEVLNEDLWNKKVACLYFLLN